MTELLTAPSDPYAAPGWAPISPVGTAGFRADLARAEDGPAPEGVLLARAESAVDVAELERRLPGVPIVAVIESALGVERALEIATAPGVVRLAFGVPAYRRDTGEDEGPDALVYAHGRLVNVSRAAGLPGPLEFSGPR